MSSGNLVRTRDANLYMRWASKQGAGFVGTLPLLASFLEDLKEAEDILDNLPRVFAAEGALRIGLPDGDCLIEHGIARVGNSVSAAWGVGMRAFLSQVIDRAARLFVTPSS